MIPCVRRFDRDGYTLVIDTTVPGRRLVSHEFKNPDGTVTLRPVRQLPTRLTGQTAEQTAAAISASKAARAAYVPTINRSDCVHALGYFLDENNQVETTPQVDCSCGEKRVSVWECSIYGEAEGYDGVAPLARGTLTDPRIRKCADCPRYEAKAK
jgi:hypothetical protein